MAKYAHMCRDGHAEIGFNDGETETCPVCDALARDGDTRLDEECSCDEWEPGVGKINAPILLAQARNPHLTRTPGFQFTAFRFCPWCGRKVRTPLAIRAEDSNG